MLHGFTDECAEADLGARRHRQQVHRRRDARDFNFPIVRADHVQQAVLAAQDIQRRWAQQRERCASGGGASVGLGIGIHTGLASIGEIGTAYKDFTIIGPVVNMAARIQGAASAGEILTSADVYHCVADQFPRSPSRECLMKGIDLPVTVHPLTV